jgi:hypothetical protein
MHHGTASSRPLTESTANWLLFVIFATTTVAGGVLLYALVMATQ